MMSTDVFKLLPLVFRLLPLLPRGKALLTKLTPTIDEFRHVAPHAVSLVRQLVSLLTPTVRELIKVWPEIRPEAVALVAEALPEVAREWGKPHIMPVAGDVEWVQETLNKLGADIKVDGNYGRATRRAVKEFQQKQGLAVDGWAGMITLAAMYTELRKL